MTIDTVAAAVEQVESGGNPRAVRGCYRGLMQGPDGPRYKALGNSWAVPVVRWIGQRIADATNPQSPPTVGATA